LAFGVHLAAGVGELGTFRTASGDLIHCRIDRTGRIAAYRESGAKLVRCDVGLVLGAVKLSDDPDWLTEPDPELVEAAPGD
jgi:hypothetical protein